MPWTFTAGVNVLSPAKVVKYTKRRKGQVAGTAMMIEERTKPVMFYPDAGNYWEVDFEVDTMNQVDRDRLENILNNLPTTAVTIASPMGDIWVMRMQGSYEAEQVRAVPLPTETTPLRYWYHYSFTLVEVA